MWSSRQLRIKKCLPSLKPPLGDSVGRGNVDERFLAPVADCLVGQDNADRTTPNQCATARGCVAFDHWLSHEKKATTDILKTELKMFNKSLRGKSWAESRV